MPKKANSFTAILLKKLCDANREIKVFVAYNSQPPLKYILQRRLLLGYEVLSIATVVGKQEQNSGHGAWGIEVITYALFPSLMTQLFPHPTLFPRHTRQRLDLG